MFDTHALSQSYWFKGTVATKEHVSKFQLALPFFLVQIFKKKCLLKSFRGLSLTTDQQTWPEIETTKNKPEDKNPGAQLGFLFSTQGRPLGMQNGSSPGSLCQEMGIYLRGQLRMWHVFSNSKWWNWKGWFSMIKSCTNLEDLQSNSTKCRNCHFFFFTKLHLWR